MCFELIIIKGLLIFFLIILLLKNMLEVTVSPFLTSMKTRKE